MGSGMAKRLLAANFPLSVYSRSRDKAAAFGSAGAKIASSPRDAASGAEIILSMVADDEASREVWLGENGALAGVSGASVLIESSTLTAGWIRELASAAEKKGCEFLDAPVTGSKPQAASGELTFLVGGSAATLERVRPVLSVLGRDAIHLGPHGSGAMMKLINNFLCGVQAASVAEATAMIDGAGLNRTKAMSILAAGAPGSPIVQRIASRLEANDFNPNFTLKLMAKDLSYAVKEAAARDLRLQTASSALAIFEQAMAAGCGDEDFSAVTKTVKHG